MLYIGDGVGTSGDGDPVALAQRLGRLDARGASFHAVSTGSSYEKVVLEAVARLGRGTVRATGDDAAQTAYQLLAEAARPALQDLRVSFRGVRTARVYPEPLPPLPLGQQQIVLGRFLPGATEGEVVVEGRLDDEPVRFATSMALAPDADASFLPRLWARRHLDALLAQGTAADNVTDIVAFSQEFGIITPYTSFLVLENDEDRARYGVERKVAMRDGELLFAEARDAVATEVLRAQMKQARTWRLRLRTQMLREIARLGEDLYGWSGALGDVIPSTDAAFLGGSLRSSVGGGAGVRFGGRSRRELAFESEARLDLGESLARTDDKASESSELDFEEELDELLPATEAFDDDDRFADAARAPRRVMQTRAKRPAFSPMSGPSTPGPAGPYDRRGYYSPPAPAAATNWGFPALAAKPPEHSPPGRPDGDDDVLAMLANLDRGPRLQRIAGAVAVRMEYGPVHPIHGRLQPPSTAESWLTGDSWLLRRQAWQQQPHESWLTDGRRGELAAALRLGRERAATPNDHRHWPMTGIDYGGDLLTVFAGWRARALERDGERAVIALVAPAPQRSTVRLTIDTERNLVTEARRTDHGATTQIQRWDKPVRAGGLWWPSTSEQLDADGRVVWRMTLQVQDAALQDGRQAFADAGAARADALLIPAADPTVDKAKQAVLDGNAGHAERLALLSHYAGRQQWQRAWQEWQALEPSLAGKPGARWIRLQLLAISRRGVQLQQALHDVAQSPQWPGAAAAMFQAGHALGLAEGQLDNHEMLRLTDAMQAGYAVAGPYDELRLVAWGRVRARALERLGRAGEALALLARIATERPNELRAHLDHLDALANAGAPARSRRARGGVAAHRQLVAARSRPAVPALDGCPVATPRSRCSGRCHDPVGRAPTADRDGIHALRLGVALPRARRRCRRLAGSAARRGRATR